MKNKFIILTLCFTIIFTNINLNNYKSYANNSITPLVVDGGIISAPMLATVSALAVGTGILIKNNDDIYDIGRLFYDYVKRNNELTWDFVQSSFLAGYTLVNDVVHVDKSFTDIVKGFFDSTFKVHSDVSFNNVPIGGIPFSPDFVTIYPGTSFSFGQYEITLELSPKPSYYSSEGILRFYDDGKLKSTKYVNLTRYNYECIYLGSYNSSQSSLLYKSKDSNGEFSGYGSLGAVITSQVATVGSFPYSGGYDWDKVKDRENEESIALPIPGNLDSLVGQGSDSFWDNTDGLVGGGSISLPVVGDPSIDVTDDVFIGNPSVDVPGTDNPSIPNDSIWVTIKDFVVSLVVPSDTFWTDLFTNFRDNLQSNFPMLDMSAFDSLLVDGKPFPNMFAFGGKIVDGDTINSIVDWLRPIVAGFVMLLLLFFNYRKLHKIIRNSDPYGSVAEKGCTSNVN